MARVGGLYLTMRCSASYGEEPDQLVDSPRAAEQQRPGATPHLQAHRIETSQHVLEERRAMHRRSERLANEITTNCTRELGT